MSHEGEGAPLAYKKHPHKWEMEENEDQNKCWIPSGSHIEVSRQPVQKIRPNQQKQQNTSTKTKQQPQKIRRHEGLLQPNATIPEEETAPIINTAQEGDPTNLPEES